MNNPQAPQFNHDNLTDGYISYTFGSRNAENYLVIIFKVDAQFVQAARRNNAFYVLNQPPAHPNFSPPALTIQGQNAWLLDFAVRSGGSVVPQKLWFPQGQGDRRRYVEQAQFRMPMFFVNVDRSLGVPVLNAAAGQMQLQGVGLPPQLADKSTIKIRISVCVRSLPERSPSLTVLQWPGYDPSERQVQLKDQTPARNPVTLERFVKHVASRVLHFLEVCLSRK
jgi:hypothetical protein